MNKFILQFSGDTLITKNACNPLWERVQKEYIEYMKWRMNGINWWRSPTISVTVHWQVEWETMLQHEPDIDLDKHKNKNVVAAGEGCLSSACWDTHLTSLPSACWDTHPTQYMLGYTPPMNRILDTHLWKHYLSATTVADGNYSD